MPMANAISELFLQTQVNWILGIYKIFGDITNAVNSQVTWSSHFAVTNLDCKMLKYKPYNNFCMARDNSGRVRQLT